VRSRRAGKLAPRGIAGWTGLNRFRRVPRAESDRRSLKRKPSHLIFHFLDALNVSAPPHGAGLRFDYSMHGCVQGGN
jgi:hypothetical protein